MPIPLTREELDAGGCGTLGCTHDHSVLFIHSNCHPHNTVDVAYHKREGVLEFRCSKCAAVVTQILVAESVGPKSNHGMPESASAKTEAEG